MRARPLLAVLALAAAGLTACGTAGTAAPASPAAAPTGASSGPSSGSSSPASAGTAPAPAGNGLATASDDEVLKQATAAFAAARSVHLVGDVLSGGSKVHLDVRAGAGRTGRGSVTLDGARFDLVITTKALYVGGNDAFWKQAGGKGAVSLFRGKYLKTNRKNPDFRQIMEFFDLAALGRNVLPHDTLRGKGLETVDGVEVRVLKDGGDARYAVATTGKPYPLRWSGSEGTDRIDLAFSDFDAPLDLTPPKASKVIDADALK